MKPENQEMLDYLTNRISALEKCYKDIKEISQEVDNEDFQRAYSSIAAGLWSQADEVKKAMHMYLKIHGIKLETV